MREWLIIGGPVEPIRAPSGVPRAYADLLARFGAGTFNDFVHLVPPKETQSYGERLGVELGSHIVFATSDNGDALTWDERGVIHRFPPRSFEPERVDLLDWLAKGSKKPFFVPRRERRRFRARFAGKASDFSKAINALDGEAELLARDKGPSWVSCKLHVPACDGLARVQHAAGFWQLAFDAKAKTKKSAFDAVLRAFGIADAPLK